MLTDVSHRWSRKVYESRRNGGDRYDSHKGGLCIVVVTAKYPALID